jgi:SAM-dependent methyltransferase
MKFRSNTCTCGSAVPAARLFPATDVNFRTTSDTAWMLKCRACGSIYPAAFPSADTLHEAYVSYYTEARARSGWRAMARNILNATRRNHLLRKTPRSASSVLDYGCGSGAFLRLLAKHRSAARLTGTDIARPAALAHDTFEWMTPQALEAGATRFDWITLSHVIEHLPDAGSVMRTLRRVCRQDGGVWISTPNAESVLIAAFGPSARDVDFPRHRQLFSRSGLVDLLERAGFSITFESSPRVDTLMNFASSSRNLVSAQDLAWSHKLRILAFGVWRIAVHLLKPSGLRAIDSPEIVVVARPVPSRTGAKAAACDNLDVPSAASAS